MSNLYTEPTKDDLVYFAQRVLAALDAHVPGWSNTTLRCPTYPDCAADTIRRLAQSHRRLLGVVYGANPRTILNDEYHRVAKEASKTTERADDQGPAHGLRQHSIGSTYPCVVVGSIVDGVTYYHVEFGGYRSHKMRNGELVQRWAERIAQQYRTGGWTYAVDYFKSKPYCLCPVERRYG